MVNLTNVNRIFIMLGQQCNLSCGYCMQHDLINEEVIIKDFNKDIYKFIEQCADNCVDKKPLITFYGGEPLLFFETIKEIVENTKDSVSDFSVITNGKKLTQEMVDFFNEHDFHIAVSWDGDNVIHSRYYDVFSDSTQKDLIFQLNNVAINGVLSSVAYPMDYIKATDRIAQQYKEKSGRLMNVSHEKFMNFPSCAPLLSDIDFEKFQEQIDEICQLAEKAIMEKDFDSPYYKFFISLAEDYRSEVSIPKCGNGTVVVNLDIHGNLYNCHNTWKKIGTIYDDTDKYLVEVSKNIATKADKECIECAVYNMCSCGCPVVPIEDKIKLKQCDYRRAYYTPVLNMLNKLRYDKNIMGYNK